MLLDTFVCVGTLCLPGYCFSQNYNFSDPSLFDPMIPIHEGQLSELVIVMAFNCQNPPVTDQNKITVKDDTIIDRLAHKVAVLF